MQLSFCGLLRCFCEWAQPMSHTVLVTVYPPNGQTFHIGGTDEHNNHILTPIMWHTKCDTHNVTHIMWWGGDTDDTDREPTQPWKHKRLKAQNMIEPRLKTYSDHHKLSYPSTQNTPRAYVGRPTCLLHHCHSLYPRSLIFVFHYSDIWISLYNHNIDLIFLNFGMWCEMSIGLSIESAFWIF